MTIYDFRANLYQSLKMTHMQVNKKKCTLKIVIPVMLSAKLVSFTVGFLRPSDRRLHVTCCVLRSLANISRKDDTLFPRCSLLMLVRTG